MHGTSFPHPRANIPQPVAGRCRGMGIPARRPRRRVVKRPVRCAVHVRRQPAARVRARRLARVCCRCATAREPDPEGDLPPS